MTWFYNMHLVLCIGFYRCKCGWKNVQVMQTKGSLSTHTHVTTESCSTAHARHDHDSSFTCLWRCWARRSVKEHPCSISTTWAPSWEELHWICFFLSRIWMLCPKIQIAAAKQVFYSSLNFSTSGIREEEEEEEELCSNSSIICMLLESLHL